MTISGTAGPLVIYGQNPAQAGTNYQPDYNGDNAPSAIAGGTILLDPRYGFRAALQAGTLAAFGLYVSGSLLGVDEAPATLAGAAIAALSGPTSGTPLPLVTTSGAGVVVSTTANVNNTLNGATVANTSGIVTMPASGIALPVGTVFINSIPSFIYFGQNGAIAVRDPRTSIARAVSHHRRQLPAPAGRSPCAVGTMTASPMTEIITLGAGVNTVVGKRAFKAIKSVIPGFSDATHSISVGTADVFGLPLMATSFAQVEISWNSASISANTGFLAGVATTMTGTNGDTRGTYAVQSASDGTKLLQIYMNPAPYNVGQANGVNSLFGQVQYSA
jgi:hypothetical protein